MPDLEAATRFFGDVIGSKVTFEVRLSRRTMTQRCPFDSEIAAHCRIIPPSIIRT
jgi:hypothetical protein